MINKITEAEINNIESNSVLALPNDPTGAGYKAERIKHAFIDPITGKTGSIVSVINRLIDNINAEPGSVTISNIEPTEKVTGDVWVNSNGEVSVYNGSAWEKKLDIVTSGELETQVSNINSALNNKASIANIVDINNKIPAQASINNKLADKAFVNSSVSTATATFQGTYTNIADLPTEGVDLNDYAFVSGVEDGNAYYDRYKYTGSEWKKEYRLNNSSFTAEQWAAINSGITSGKISEINNLIVGLSFTKADKDSVYTKNETLNKIDEKVSQGLDALGAEQVVNKTAAISADSTDTQYPSAKAVYTLTNAIEKKVDENTKDINSLKAIVSNTVVTDTEVSDKYHTRKTGDSLSIIDGAQTKVNKISGNTISSKNLIPYPYLFTTSTSNGLTFTSNTDGSIKVNGTTTKKNFGVPITSYFYLPTGTYKISGYNGITITVRKYASTSDQEGTSWIDSTATINQTGTLTETTLIRVQLWCTADVGTTFNFTMFPMLNEGSTALPYYQYFSGLKNAGFKSILSTGKNLVNTDGLFSVGAGYVGLTCSKNADGTYKLDGTATASFCYGVDRTSTACYIPQGATIYFTPYYDITTTATGSYKLIGIALYDKDGGLVKQWNSGISSGTVTSFVVTRDVAKVAFVWNISGSAGLAVTIDNIKFMLSYENTNVFEPYKSDGIACESNIELAEFDYAVPSENKVYRQSATITFDGSSDESWTVYTYSSTGKIVFLSTSLQHGSITQASDGIVANVSGVVWASTYTNSSIEIPSSSVGNVTTEGDLRTYLATNNLVVTYKGTTVTTEDVSFDKADYTAYLNGSESVMQGDNNIGDYGEECTVDQNFYVKNEV